MWMVDSNNHSKELKMPTDPERKLQQLMPRLISSCSSTPYPTPYSCCCVRNPNTLPICEYGVKRDGVALVSTRWNPTPEQLQALGELYRRGIRTPSAEQIQQIASKLRRFGKIEGKNVFYWFQNHKARERHKNKRRLLAKNQTPAGVSRRYVEIEHQLLPNSTTPPKDSEVGWAESLEQKILTAKDDKACSWQLHFPWASTVLNNADDCDILHSHDMKEDQTLELFPIGDKDREMETKFRPIHFIEFLPTKN